MTVAQYGTGPTSATALAARTYVACDRWAYQCSIASKFTVAQSTLAPAGFTNSLLVTSSAATTPLGASDYYVMCQPIEGYNMADLAWGTASAKTITLSFQVYASVTGTFGGAIENGGANYTYPFTYTVSSINTWTPISITISGPTSGTWATNNTTGMFVWLSLGVGSAISGTAGAWASQNVISATGATNLLATSGATIQWTGVQLEVGTAATNFENIDIARLTVQCQRYFQKSDYSGNLGSAGATGFVCNKYSGSDSAIANIPLICAMRTSPTVTSSNGAARFVLTSSVGGSATIASLGSPPAGPITVSLTNNAVAAGYGWVDGVGVISISAEL